MATDWRIDKVPYISAEIKDYRVPCGTLSIMWLGGTKPTNRTIQTVTNCIRKPTDIFIISSYSLDKRDYVIHQLVFPLDYNGEKLQ